MAIENCVCILGLDENKAMLFYMKQTVLTKVDVLEQMSEGRYVSAKARVFLVLIHLHELKIGQRKRCNLNNCRTWSHSCQTLESSFHCNIT